MNIMTFILVFSMIWMVIMFIALPMGIKVPDKIEKGHASSAPENPQIFKKSLITFFISIVLTLIYWYMIVSFPQIGNILNP